MKRDELSCSGGTLTSETEWLAKPQMKERPDYRMCVLVDVQKVLTQLQPHSTLIGRGIWNNAWRFLRLARQCFAITSYIRACTLSGSMLVSFPGGRKWAGDETSQCRDMISLAGPDLFRYCAIAQGVK